MQYAASTFNMDLAPLAQRTAELSRSLAMLGPECEHADTRFDIADLSNECLRLSSTLWRLREAIDINKDKYTQVFSQDLAEISSELQLVCDEIAECCAEMQKMDTPGPVPLLKNKGRVSNLQKHLIALKTTLVVMRTVLHHSKDYGLQTSPHCLAESSLHILQEDRAILDSVFAKNRHAIQELCNAEKSYQSSPSDCSLLGSGFQPKPRARSHSSSTSLTTPLLCRDLAEATMSSSSPTDTNHLELHPRFSKRATQISVHMSILGMAPSETTTGLRERWLQAAKSTTPASNSSPTMMQMPVKTAASENSDDSKCLEAKDPLSTPISRTETSGDGEGGDGGGGQEQTTDDKDDKDDKGEVNCEAKDGIDHGHSHGHGHCNRHSATRRSGHSLKRFGSPAAHVVRRLIKKLSLNRTMTSPNQTTFEDS